MKIVCISDTHLRHDFEIPPGDLLIHAGDLTLSGTSNEIRRVGQWLQELPHPYKIVIAGNHDFLFEKDGMQAEGLLGSSPRGLVYLDDSGIVVEGLKIWGSPWTPRFYNWAFQLDPPNRPLLLNRIGMPGRDAKEHWKKIPPDLDILVTHGPPLGILDQVGEVVGGKEQPFEHVGDPDLALAVKKKKPRHHIFGHIHSGNGEEILGPTHFVNAAICDEAYRPTQKPIVFEV